MRDFIDTSNNSIWSFDDDVVFEIEEGIYTFYTASGVKVVNVPTTLTPYTPPVITQEEAAAIEKKRLWRVRQQDALVALVATDTVALRCFKAGAPYPQDWNEYTWALRNILSADDGNPSEPFPVKPDYPENT
ncbi:hypothetical protein [Pseudomonas sp. 29]|uniref:hypothetical protein n=1 Tax=Pseudomonas sp. 29 TaxID=2035197 RepID=UPI00256F569F|nr:hypothetical protein [Pseudomonas sp. 29]